MFSERQERVCAELLFVGGELSDILVKEYDVPIISNAVIRLERLAGLPFMLPF